MGGFKQPRSHPWNKEADVRCKRWKDKLLNVLYKVDKNIQIENKIGASRTCTKCKEGKCVKRKCLRCLDMERNDVIKKLGVMGIFIT